MSGLRRTRLNGWFEFTKEVCPICNHSGGCLINEKGDTVVCIRISSEIVFSKTFQSWIHHLGEKKIISVNNSKVKERTKAESWTLDSFFRLMDKQLVLENKHRQQLHLDRKMTNEQIQIRQYKSFPTNSWATASAVVNQIPNFNELDLGIPGFYKNNKSWAIKGGAGILIPYRNEENEIIGYQIRIDEPKNFVTIRSSNGNKLTYKAILHKQPNLVRVVNEDGELILEKEFKMKEEIKVVSKEDPNEAAYVKLNKGQRYYWLSSANQVEGCGAGGPTPYHVALPTKKLAEMENKRLADDSLKVECESAWLTEGALKGDIAIEQLQHALGNKLKEIGDVMLSVAGVNSWKIILPVIKKMKIKRINLAFDIDSMKNEQVANQLKDCIVELKKIDIEVYLAFWNPIDGKGIDDLLLNKKIPILKKM